MKFNKLDENKLKTMYPNNGIKMENIENKDEYIELNHIYRSLLTEYIINKFNLKEYDNELRQSELNYVPLKKEKMDIYQYFSANELMYFYIRNNTYVEKLSEEDKKFFTKRIEEENYELDEEAIKIIERTYSNIIMEDVKKDGKKYIVMYGPNSSNYLAQNDSIIIGVNYDEFELNGMDENNWSKVHDEQLKKLYTLVFNMQRKLNKENKNVKIIKYNLFSANKLGTN